MARSLRKPRPPGETRAERRSRRPLPPWLLGLGGLGVIVGLVAVLVAFGSGDDPDEPPPFLKTPTTVAGRSPDRGLCRKWSAGIEGEPLTAKADTPGLHIWTDPDGWHVRRMPGPNVPLATVTITTEIDQPVVVNTTTGGAVLRMDGRSVVIDLPVTAQVATATFGLSTYADSVGIDARDALGDEYPPELTFAGASSTATELPIASRSVRIGCGL